MRVSFLSQYHPNARVPQLTMRYALLLFLCALLLDTSTANARRMEVLWGAGTGIENRNLALAQAFTDAALTESLEILNPAPAPEREQALRDYLAHNTGALVESYTELESISTPDGTLLSAEVRINPIALRNVLKQTGIYYTLQTSIPYALKMPADLDQKTALPQLPQLELLAGLQQNPNAPVQLSVQRSKKNIWNLRLAWQGDINTVSDADFNLAWGKTWTAYFHQNTPTGNAVWFIITTKSWRGPDGIQQLNKLLEAQKDVFTTVKLEGMSITPAGMQAVWKVQTNNKNELERLVSSSITEGVQYTISQVPERE